MTTFPIGLLKIFVGDRRECGSSNSNSSLVFANMQRV